LLEVLVVEVKVVLLVKVQEEIVKHMVVEVVTLKVLLL